MGEKSRYRIRQRTIGCQLVNTKAADSEAVTFVTKGTPTQNSTRSLIRKTGIVESLIWNFGQFPLPQILIQLTVQLS